MFKKIMLCVLIIFSCSLIYGLEKPFVSDKNTVLLLHLDGNAEDSSNIKNNVKSKNIVWADNGKFGKCAYFNGKNGLIIRSSGALHIGERSWTFEVWIKPEKEQPKYSYIFAGGWGNERMYYLRIMNGKFLHVSFSSGTSSCSLATSDISNILFDGNWHLISVVVDRERKGEIRLYIDGKRVLKNKNAFCEPIVFESKKMGFVIGSIAPWYVGKSGYKGYIDEVRISDTIREKYKTELPLKYIPPEKKSIPQVSPDYSCKKIVLTPEKTFILIHHGVCESNTYKAAHLLQKWLRKIYKTDKGFEILREMELNKISNISDKVLIGIGKTQWVKKEEIKDLEFDGYIVKKEGNVIVICGNNSRGNYFGAVCFLDKVCSIRFYMPTDLFVSRPEKLPIEIEELNIKVNPFAIHSYLSGGKKIPGDTTNWTENVGGNRRLGASHQHTMNWFFPPEKYGKKYPEIYPILKGKRYIPEEKNDQKWQPCFSEPELLEAAKETIKEYFIKNPSYYYIACSINDSHYICECPRCMKIYEQFRKEYPKHYKAVGHSFIYWEFMNKLAEWMEKEYPDKYLIGLAYGPTRFTPPFKLKPNIIVITNFHIAELEADKILTPGKDGLSKLDKWLNVCSNFGNHDWYHGNGFLLPRIYSNYWSHFMKTLSEKVNYTFMHIESYPNWGLDGIKYYIVSRLFFNPNEDVNKILNQFCKDMFGEAAKPMEEYFKTLEKLWIILDNKKGPERKLFQWSRQFIADKEDMAIVKKCRELLDKSIKLAKGEKEKKRIELFSKTFKLSEYLFEIRNSKSVSKEKIEQVKQYIENNIANDPMTLYNNNKAYLFKVVDTLSKGKIKK